MKNPLRIAVASGKGGTGKTTIATNLSTVLAGQGERTAYVDCDVEEPNGHIFFRPSIHMRHQVSIPVPAVDESKCTLCGACEQICRSSAILALPKKIITFPKLCHGCGGCSLVCPAAAISETPRQIGVVEEGTAGDVFFVHGKLNIGESMAPPVIREVLLSAPKNHTLIVDAPPGTSCPVIESVKSADVVLLVTEPMPFGLNDLKLAVEMVRELDLPFGVAVNRAGIGDEKVFDYCRCEDIPILLELPDDRGIAQDYSRGIIAATAMPWLKPFFVSLFSKLRALAQQVVRKKTRPQIRPVHKTTALNPRPSEILQHEQKHDLQELVVISGKGGTGKTSIVASFFALAEQSTVADVDVDAADLHLVLDPAIQNRWPFSGGHLAMTHKQRCTGCALCIDHCRFDAIRPSSHKMSPAVEIDTISCEGCGVCAHFCPEKAISMVPATNGEWFVSQTRHGPMVHARLGIAQENSGKLVSLIRREAKALAALNKCNLLLCDGSPGIGCPVMASITGAQMVLVVTEPTLSGLHDLKRVLEITRQFNVPTGICINKSDINPEISSQIEKEALALDLMVLGKIRYDESVSVAQVKRIAVVEHNQSLAAKDIRALWEQVKKLMFNSL
jgi:MinD superfamily P-loop ATPase